MDYNSTREKLIMPEYGRNIQKMIHHAVSIKDRDERNKCAAAIIKVMITLFPNVKKEEDFEQKLWDHLAIMSDYKLDIDSPYPTPQREQIEQHPQKLPYDNHNIKLKHYGHIVETMIEKAKHIDDPGEQKAFIESIANFMKKSLIALNKDFATDERLFNDIRMLSGNELEIDATAHTAEIHEAALLNMQPAGKSGKKKKNKNNQNKAAGPKNGNTF